MARRLPPCGTPSTPGNSRGSPGAGSSSRAWRGRRPRHRRSPCATRGFPCRWGRRVRPRDPSSLRVRNNDTGQRTNNVQERTNREIKRRSRVVQVFPSTGSLVRLAGAVMCEQDEIWQESRYFSEARMNELYDDGRTRGIDGPVDRARLEAEARKMLESGLELADRVEAA